MGCIIAGIFMIIIIPLFSLPFYWISEAHTTIIIPFCIFSFLGILLIVAGIAEIITRKNINEHGFKCYGIVKRLMQNGEYSSDKEGGNIIVQIVNPNTNQIEDIKYYFDYNSQKTPTNTYVLCKCYKEHIIIQENLAPIEVPENIRALLIPAPKRKFENLEFSQEGNTVTIDGIEYEKIS